MRVIESSSGNCHNCFRFSHYVVEIKIGSNEFCLCSRCTDSLKDELKELREE